MIRFVYFAILVVLSGFVNTGVWAQTKMTVPTITSSFKGMTRGYVFKAPCNFSIVGLKVPTNYSSANSYIAVVNFGTTPPPDWNSTTNNFTTLAYLQNISGTSIISVNIAITKGNYIGIMGCRNSTTCYGSSGAFSTSIDGLSSSLTCMGMQADLTSSSPGSLWKQLSNNIGVVEMYYYVPNFAADAGIGSISRPTATNTVGIDTIKARIVNYGKDTLKTAALRWSVDNINQSSPSNWTGSLAKKYDSTAQFAIGTYNFGIGKHVIKVWTASPNNSTDSNITNDTAQNTIYSCVSGNGTYVIDPAGSGHFLNFTTAIDWLKICGVSGAVTFRIKAGTYNEQLLIPPITGASSANTITFESYDLDSTSVVLTSDAATSSKNYLVKLDGADYITFRKITLQSTASYYCNVIEFANSADNNSLKNNIIKSQASTQPVMAPIYSYTTLDQNNTIQNNIITGGYYGIYWYGISSSSTETGNVFQGNIIKDFYSKGIYTFYQNAMSINNNQIINLPSVSSAEGIHASDCKNNSDISGNIIQIKSSGTIYGIYLSYCYATSSQQGRISNNMISCIGESSANNYGIMLNNPAYYNLYYNSIAISGSNSTTYNYAMYIWGGTSGSINLQNNIMANLSGGFAFYSTSSTSISSSDYNNLYTTGSYLGYWPSSNRTNLAAWQSATSKDAHSKSVNPGYYTTSNLHVNTIGISNMGTPISGISADVEGDSRNGTSPDIGADEFSLISNDAGVISYYSPVNPCPGSNNLKARIKNYGIAKLTTITIYWEINGVSQTAISHNISLDQYADTALTLGSFTFNDTTAYRIKMWTSQPNGITDSNGRNDTFVFSNLYSALKGTYTIGGSTANYLSFSAAVNDLKSRTICGAVLFRVYPGNYNECISIPLISGSSSTNTITFESYNHDSNSVDLNYASTISSQNYVVQLMGAKYVTFRQMKIKASGSAYGVAVDITGGSEYNSFVNNIIQSLFEAPNSYFAGVHSAYSSSLIDNNNTILNNIISGGYYGVYMYGPSTTSRENMNVIKNNWIKDYYNYGVYSCNQTSNSIEGNRIQTHSGSTTVYGIYMTYNHESIKIIKNKIELSGQGENYGIYAYNCIGTSSKIGLIANNFVSVTGSSFGLINGFYLYYSSYQNVLYNSVNIVTNSGINSIALKATNGSYLAIASNVLANFSGGYSVYISPGTNVSSCPSNNLYTTGSKFAYWNADLANLTAWRAASKDTFSISSNPYFYSSTDLHSYSRKMDSAAKYYSNVTKDIDDQNRSYSKPDIGADEFTIPSRDGGIADLVEPVVPCPGTATNVIVKLRNYGINNITSAKIQWSVNGNNQTTKIFTGNLANMKDTNIVIGSYTFYTGTKYSIKTWTDSINGNTDQLHHNDSFTRDGIQTVKSGTFTIGKTGRDYSSFNSALKDIAAYGICAPVTFVVDTGSYNEQISIPEITGTSVSNTITFTSASNDSSRVDLNFAATADSNNYVVQLKGADYITFNKIKIRATGSKYARAVHVSGGADHNTFTGNMILSKSLSNDSTASGFYFDNSLDNYNTLSNNYISGGYYGISMYGGNSVVRENLNVIKNNIVKDYNFSGIRLYYQNSPNISGNLIESNSSIGLCNGILGYGIYDSMKIERNRINLSGTANNQGLVLTVTGSSSNTAVVANNSISILNGSAQVNSGMNIGICSYLNIYNNSVNLNTFSSGADMAFNSKGGSNINLVNNIFAATGDGYAAYVVSPGSVNTSDYNDLFSKGTYIGYWAGNNISSLTDWKNASSKDQHSYSTDPYFYTNTNLNSYSTILDSAGLPLSVIRTDIDNYPRNAKYPDIGAYEFSAFSYDAGIPAFTGPITPCPGMLSNVTVKLKNYGYQTLNSVKINWSVNDTIQQSFYYSGSLANLKDTVIDIGNYKFYYGVSYNIKAWVNTVNSYADQNYRNDTISQNGITTALSGTLTIGRNGRDYESFTQAVNDLIKNGVCRKVTFVVDSGTYREQISIPPISGASATNTITFTSATGDSTDVILLYKVFSSSYPYVVRLDGADYIRFEKMTLRLSDSSGYSFITVDIRNGANYNSFKNNIIIATSISQAAIYNNTSSDNYNIIENNWIYNGYYGIYQAGSSNSLVDKGNVIRRNKIERYEHSGIYSTYQDSFEITGNNISTTSTIFNPEIYGIHSQYDYNKSQICNNRIKLTSDLEMCGIYMKDYIGTKDQPLLVANNFVTITGNCIDEVFGIYSLFCSYTKIYHNSVEVSCGGGAGKCLYLGTGYTSSFSNNNVMNNILRNTGYGYAMVYAAPLGSPYLNKSDYNNFYSNSSTRLLYHNLNSFSTIAGWRSYVSQDMHSINTYPPFVSSTDLHLTNYTSFLLPNPLTEVPYDIDGNYRSTRIPTIGGDEKPPIPNDAGITGFVKPDLAGCEGNLPIEVILRNFGTNKLSSVKINCSVNGVSMPQINASCSLSYLEDTTIFIGYKSFAAGTNYKIVAETQLPNGVTDLYTDNNADTFRNPILYPFPVINSIKNDSICAGSRASLSASSKNSSHFYWYDSITGGKLLAETPSIITDTLYSNHTYYVEARTIANPDSLITSGVTGLSEMGNMFDVQALNTDIYIQGFAVQPASLSGVSIPIAIYYRKGSYVGYERTDSVWTLLGMDTIISKGGNKFVSINIETFKINAGDTIGFYITTTDFNTLLNYTDTSSMVNDSFIRISCGTIAYYPFDKLFQSGKTWNGKVYYSIGALCTSARTAVEAVIRTKPAKDLGPDRNICMGSSAEIHTAFYPGYTYVWKKASKPDTLSVTNSLTINSSGSYIVYIKNQCGLLEIDTLNVILYPSPLVNFLINDSTQCFKGNKFIFTNTTNPNKTVITGYTWDFGDLVRNHDTNTSHIYSYDSIFKVKLITTSSNGCVDSVIKTVIVSPEPLSKFELNDTIQCLLDNKFTSTNNSTIKSGTLAYEWKLGDGSKSFLKNISHTYATSGNYQIQLIASSDKSCKDSVSSFVIVKANPFIDLGKDTTLKHNQTISLHAGSGMDSYLWSTNDKTNQITVDTSGIGDVGTKKIWVMVEKDLCFSSDTILIHFIHNNGITEGSYQQNIKVYPNPASNEIFIESNLPFESNLRVIILNEFGKEVGEFYSISNSSKLLRIDAAKLLSGVYFIKIISENNSHQEKVLIIK